MNVLLIRLFSIAILLIPVFCAGQVNLVNNPSFEDTIQCPNGPGQIPNANNWFLPTWGSTDFFHTCSSPTAFQSFNVPVNYFGYEYPVSGNAYVGIGVYGDFPGLSNNYREYASGLLASPLNDKETYCVQFYVNLSDSSEYAINNIGLHFSDTSINNIQNYEPLQIIPQVENDGTNNPLTTFNNWIKISGTFVSTGGEQFIIIGNFNDNNNSDTVFVRSVAVGQPSFKTAYYYVDDVSVIHLNADAGRDTAICTGSSVVLGRASDPYITSYTWWPSQGLSATTIAQPTASPVETTTYFLTATMASGCSKTDTVTITVVNDIYAGPDKTICQGDTVQLGTLPAQDNVTYSWIPSTNLTNSNEAQTLAFPQQTTSYYLTASSNGCNLIDTIDITVLDYITPFSYVIPETEICRGDTVKIGSLSNKTAYSYTWNPKDFLSSDSVYAPFAFPNASTTYTLTITDKYYLCSNPVEYPVTVSVDECPENYIFPNIITPNGDGINDYWSLQTLPQGTQALLYNRWGTLVNMLSESIDFDGHNSQGLLLPDGVYFYKVILPNGDLRKGFIQILRK